MNSLGLLPVFVLLFAFLSSGCVESEETYFLNPDGSGKVRVQFRVPISGGTTRRIVDPEELARDQVKKVLSDSKGVEVWSEVTWSNTLEGQLEFSGTAYFPDLNRFSLHYGISAVNNTTNEGFNLDLRDEEWVLSMKLDGPDKRDPPDEPETLSEEEIQRRVNSLRLKYFQKLPMTKMMLDGLRVEKRLHLPGDADSLSVFRRMEPSGPLQLVFDGEKLLEAMRKISEDPAFWRTMARRSDPSNTVRIPFYKVISKLHGRDQYPQVTVRAPFRPQFDYEAEVANARKQYHKLYQRLNLPLDPEPVTPVDVEGIKRLDVVGVRLVQLSNWERVRPFFHEQRGYSLSVMTTLHGPVLGLENVRIIRAITLEDENLLPDGRAFSATRRRTSDPVKHLMEFTLLAPHPDSRGLRRIDGEITYYTGSELQTVDLGMIGMRAGAKLEKFVDNDTTMLNVRKQSDADEEPRYSFTLRIPLNHNSIKRVSFEDPEGDPLHVERAGMQRGQSTTSITFESDIPLPERVRIEVEAYSDLKLNRTPFSLENIDFLGRALNIPGS